MRAFGFVAVETKSHCRGLMIKMLTRNFQAGDHDIARRWFALEQDRDMRHDLGLDLRRLWDKHPEPASEVEMLLELYEKGPCSECRNFVVERLIALQTLPGEILEECAFDANEDTRELYRSTARGK